MAKTRKVMEMDFNNTIYVCVHNSTSRNPYKLYEKWFDRGWHRRKITEYADFDSVLFYLLQLKYKHVHWDIA